MVVAGYVTMRVSMILLWARAAAHDPERRRTCLAYVRFIAVAQVGWVLTVLDVLPLGLQVALTVSLFTFEVGGLAWIETRLPSTPWHPHHIAERYGLLAIITFGEVVLGTTTAIEAVVAEQGWSIEAVVIALAGVVAAWLLAASGASLSVALVVLMLAPWAAVLGYELRGYRHMAEVLGEG